MFGHPIDVWLAMGISAVIRFMRGYREVGLLQSLIAFIVAAVSAIIFDQPLINALTLSEDWTLFVVVLIALSAENLMFGIIDITSNKKFLENIVKMFVSKGGDND